MRTSVLVIIRTNPSGLKVVGVRKDLKGAKELCESDVRKYITTGRKKDFKWKLTGPQVWGHPVPGWSYCIEYHTLR